MTTPATQRDVLMQSRLVIPRNAVATESRVEWTESLPDDEATRRFPGTDHLVDAFCALASATPDEMVEFVGLYGVPEVPEAEIDESFVQTWRSGFVPVLRLRRFARGIAAARRVAADLSSRRPGERADWVEMQHCDTGAWVVEPDDFDDWKLGRERFARWLGRVLDSAGVVADIDWLGSRGLSIDLGTKSLLGVVVILVAREVEAERAYTCDSCGDRVQRRRPPRRGERVYCDRAECKREQQRRNQAAWRARKAAQAKEGS